MACSSHYSLQWLLRVKWLVFEVQNLDIFGGKLTQTLRHFEKLPSCFSNLTGIQSPLSHVSGALARVGADNEEKNT